MYFLCLYCIFFHKGCKHNWECCKHNLYIIQHSVHVTAARGPLHRFPPRTSTQPLSILTAASSPVTLTSVMLRRVWHVSPWRKKWASFASAALTGGGCQGGDGGSSAGSGWEDIYVPHRGNIATLLGRNLSETFEIPLVVGGCVCVWVCGVKTRHCDWNPKLQRATSVARHE